MTDDIIQIKNLVKNFDEFKAVNGLNLTVQKGKIFGFLGPNGAGKTTSIKMMVGLLEPTEGEILINGTKINNIQKGVIGICPQELVFWEHLTCFENIKFIGDMYNIPSKELEEKANLLLDLLFLSDKKNTQARYLSGGMKRRLNLALALIYDPDIIVLDEPSEGLDPQSKRALWDFILDLCNNKGKTIILTTHLIDEADRLSDKIAIMDHGKLLRLDTATNLKKEFGEGDVIEIDLVNSGKNDLAISILNKMNGVDQISVVSNQLFIHALDSVSKLPDIIMLLENEDISIADLSVRQNTLEDVFIELTGRGLRE